MDGSRIWFNSKVSLENNSIQKNILGFLDLRLQLHNNLSTITHCERFNIWKELWIEFWAENRWFWEFFMPVMDNLNFRAKNRGVFFVDNWQFLTCKFKFRNQYLTFFSIFDRKIQIHNFVNFSENWIFGYRVSIDSVSLGILKD